MRASYAERCARKHARKHTKRERDKKGEAIIKVMIVFGLAFMIGIALTYSGRLDGFINWILETECTETKQTVYGMGGENLCE